MAGDYSKRTSSPDHQPTTPDDGSTSPADETAASKQRERPSSSGAEDDPYRIRAYEPEDREDFLDLYDLVLGDSDGEWFRWKYEENPYTDHVPISVATHDGDIVGTKPCFALDLRAGSRTVLAFQPADVMVHPDHRRRGLYSRTTEHMKERYRNGAPSLFFNFPNSATLSGSLKHGWQIVEEVPTFYRVQDPKGLIDADAEDARRLRTVARATRPLLGGYLRINDRFAGSIGGVRVSRFESIPSSTFVSLYRRSIPPTLHAKRDEVFYDWRFENPTWSYEGYVATRNGGPIAGIVVGTRTEADDTTVTYLTDVVPLQETADRREGLRALLARILRDHARSDLIATSGRVLPRTMLEDYGFHGDDRLPLSWLTEPTTQVTYPISSDGGHPWTVNGRAIIDPSNWTVTFAEQDTK